VTAFSQEHLVKRRGRELFAVTPSGNRARQIDTTALRRHTQSSGQTLLLWTVDVRILDVSWRVQLLTADE